MSGSANTHSKLSPSSAKQWTTCTASIGYIAENGSRIPEEKDSPFAAEGTQAHDYAEIALIEVLDKGLTRDEALANIPEAFREPLAVYIDECLKHSGEGWEEMVEVKVPLFYRPDDTGTCDYMAINDDMLVVRDLKYGMGVLVRAEGNEQLAIYGQSAVKDLEMLYDFADEFPVSIGIVQPRYIGEDPISTWETTIGELREFTNEIGRIAELIQDGGDVEFSPSLDTCKWCKAKGICVARAEQARDVLPDLIDPIAEEIERPEINTLSDNQLVNIYQHKKFIETWLKDVEAHLQDRALDGDAAEGTKIVQGQKGNTKWVDEEEALTYLKGQGLLQSQRLKMDAISPTQAAKLLKDKLTKASTKRRFDQLTHRANGREVLALESDKRPAITCGKDALPDLDDDMLG
jgi:hypothetical protein